MLIMFDHESSAEEYEEVHRVGEVVVRRAEEELGHGVVGFEQRGFLLGRGRVTGERMVPRSEQQQERGGLVHDVAVAVERGQRGIHCGYGCEALASRAHDRTSVDALITAS